MEVLQSYRDSRKAQFEGKEFQQAELYSLKDEPQEDGTFRMTKVPYEAPEDLPWRSFDSNFMIHSGIGVLPTFANTDPHQAQERLMDVHVIETKPDVETKPVDSKSDV